MLCPFLGVELRDLGSGERTFAAAETGDSFGARQPPAGGMVNEGRLFVVNRRVMGEGYKARRVEERK